MNILPQISEDSELGGRKLGGFTVQYIFPNSMEKSVSYLGHFSISFVKITFCTEILTRKVELWIFWLVSLIKTHHKTTFLEDNYFFCKKCIDIVKVNNEENNYLDTIHKKLILWLWYFKYAMLTDSISSFFGWCELYQRVYTVQN